MINTLGYACLNLTLGTKSRSCVLKTFNTEGPSRCLQLAIANLQDVLAMMEWNSQNNIHLLRISSGILPWTTKWRVDDLAGDYPELVAEFYNTCAEIKLQSARLNQRLTMHPGPFNCLGSPKPDVVTETILELNQHGWLMDQITNTANHYNPINIHIGGAYGDRDAALERWKIGFAALDPNTRARLTIENDDKAGLYSVEQILPLARELGIPIKFDYFHHQLNPGNLTEEEAVKLCAETWGNEFLPVFHYSESRMAEQPECHMRTAHSDWITRLPDTYGVDCDIMLETKMKEQTILKYRNQIGHNISPTIPIPENS